MFASDKTESDDEAQQAERNPLDAAAARSAPEEDQYAPKPHALGDLLLGKGLIDRVALLEALRQQEARSGKRLGQLLVETGALDERDLVVALSEQLGFGLANLGQNTPQPEAIEKVPEAIARTHRIIPVRLRDDKLEIATADPVDERMLDQVSRAAGMEIVPLIAPTRDIEAMIDRSYKVLVGFEQHVEAFQITEQQRRSDVPLQRAVNENAPIVQVVNLIVTQALRDRASDIHIEPQDDRVRVRYRIDGALHDVVGMPANMGPAVISRVKVLASMNIVERQRPQDGQFSLSVDGRDVNFRVSTTSTIWGEKSVIRILDKSRSLFRLDDLGMPDEGDPVTAEISGVAEVTEGDEHATIHIAADDGRRADVEVGRSVRRRVRTGDRVYAGDALTEPDRTRSRYSAIIRSPSGMVLCAGPTGSGKTTTLYASLLEINSPQRNIMTIEDPVEYVFPSINQIQVREAAGISFASGLRSILRQDPDVLLVGEIRDAETASIASQAALTGHFVLSSIHATDSVTALQRFIDMGIDPFVVSSSLLAVVAQRLIRRICEHCKHRVAPKSDEIAFYTKVLRGSGKRHWAGAGCNFCAGTGYQDRIGIFELLRLDEVVKQMILDPEQRAHKFIVDYATTAGGMRTLQDQATQLVDDGLTTIAEVIRATYTLEKA